MAITLAKEEEALASEGFAKIVLPGLRSGERNCSVSLIKIGYRWYIVRTSNPEGQPSIIKAIEKEAGGNFSIAYLAKALSNFNLTLADLLRDHFHDTITILKWQCLKALEERAQNEDGQFSEDNLNALVELLIKIKGMGCETAEKVLAETIRKF